MNPNALALGLLLAAIWAVLCRLNQLEPGRTRFVVAAQYMALGIGLAGGLLLPAEWARAAMAGGTLAFLLASSNRWRNGPPDGVKIKERA